MEPISSFAGSFIPLLINGKSGKEIFRVDQNGDIVLRGVVIATDSELADTLTEIGNAIRPFVVTKVPT